MLAQFSDIAPHPDAELLDLVEKWKAAYEAWDKAHDEWSLAEDRLDAMEPEIPDAVFSRQSDVCLSLRFVCSDGERSPDGRLWHVDKVERLRSEPIMSFGWPHQYGDPGYFSDKRSQVRADEIVTAWDGYIAAKEAARLVSGEAKAAEAANSATAARHAIERQIIQYRAKTIDGIGRRLDILAQIYGDEGDFVRVTKFKAEQDPLSAMPYAILRDLKEILQSGRSHQVFMLQAAE
ncbi:MAG: hypothetical protein KF735_06745 [Chelatococcus sp.]|uniref:hypothetical protein n=1 Tax=Chelatococcus sp. TaxID=1953771 RepID=UPI0025C024BC|nr:hypothetical protein [Chelatococcus sp.]MBX3537313.1 hypothetical protein [Chelatococcus sp.]